MNPTKSEDVALAILNLVNDMDFNTGIKKLTQSLQGSTVPSTFKNSNYYSFLNIYNQDQITKIINELIKKEYLKLFNIGMGYEIPIIKLTENGFNAVKNKEPIMLDLPKIYMPQFAPANQIIESSIIDEFYEIRKKINELQIKEESLKERIKKTMLDNNIPKIVTDKMDIFCRKVQRMFYPKDKIEEMLSEEIKATIREVKETIVLSTKIDR